jgi:hypothetical protein
MWIKYAIYSLHTLKTVALFASQTLRQKILYDLSTLPDSSIVLLRDSLVAALVAATPISRVVGVQVTLCLADLSILMGDLWPNPMIHMANALASVRVDLLLEFYTLAAEEFNRPV